MDLQRKVTAFVTRGTGSDAELLVFWHTGAGVQVPAGTVEDGEPYEDAAIREVAEETGLPGLEFVDSLGTRTYDLYEQERAFFHFRPSGPTHDRLLP